MKMNFKFLGIFIFILILNKSHAEEMIFGEEKIAPGIEIIFEAAPKDSIYPNNYFLAESETDIHIEMLITWADESPTGSPVGGFIPYLNVEAIIENENGNSKTVKLTPHLNITDNFHYAQNLKLPGDIDDSYNVSISISPPSGIELGIHHDWKEKYGYLLTKKVFTYDNLSFKEIALKSRK